MTTSHEQLSDPNTVSVAMRTRTLTSLLLARSAEIDERYRAGVTDGKHGLPCPPVVESNIMHVRQNRGFRAVVANLLTPPDAQHKLAMGSIPSYGMTLAHADISGTELCAWRTDSCSAVCVLNNGNGRYDSVRRAWLWRTDLWINHPLSAAYRMGWEIGRALRVKTEILFRPDVNSDVAWHRIIPSLGNTDGMTVYGYSKNPALLADGFMADGFMYAFSWSEKANLDKVRRHLLNGGKVAVVTSRKRGSSINPDAVRAFFGVPDTVTVADADVTDEWMLSDGPVIGDLTAKGKARDLIGVSGFVVAVY